VARQAKAAKSLNTKQVRDAEATQAVILAAAEEEFAKHGLTAARTEAIAKRCSKSMIYYYFKHKEVSGCLGAITLRHAAN